MTQRITGQRFRQRKLSTKQNIPVVREHEIEKLDDDEASRHIPKVETGVEKGEEIVSLPTSRFGHSLSIFVATTAMHLRCILSLYRTILFRLTYITSKCADTDHCDRSIICRPSFLRHRQQPMALLAVRSLNCTSRHQKQPQVICSMIGCIQSALHSLRRTSVSLLQWKIPQDAHTA